jgi:uncharacterized protein (DUF58 family)
LSKLAVVAVIALLISLGMIFGSALWVLAGITGVLVLATSYGMSAIWADAATVSRDGGDQEVKIGTQLPVRIKVTNSGKLPLLWVLVEDLLPRMHSRPNAPSIPYEGTRLGVFLIGSGKEIRLEYTVDLKRRGYLQLGPTVLETGDLLGLFRRFKVAGQPSYITILPEVVPMSTFAVGSRRPIGEVRIREHVIDDPTRLRGIRQWQPGDPMRRVHWAATARTGVLHSKVYEPSSVIGVTLILDMHCDSNPEQHEPVRLDLAVSAAASIATLLHDAGEPFGLASNGRDAADRIRAEGPTVQYDRRGAAAESKSMLDASDRLRPVLMKADRTTPHYREMLGTLARLERSDGLKLPELLVESESRISSDTTMMFIVQTADEVTMSAILSQARRGRAVAVIINTYNQDAFSAIAGPLIAARIDVFHLLDRNSIADVCKALVR